MSFKRLETPNSESFRFFDSVHCRRLLLTNSDFSTPSKKAFLRGGRKALVYL